MIKENNMFNALVVRKNSNKSFSFKIEKKSINDLPEGDVLIKVLYSSINYKDGMSCLGNPAITRKFPHTPGIDAAGFVESSNCEDFMIGEKVFIIGYPLGMSISGGFGQYIRVPKNWVRKINFDLSLEEVMAYGTAGFTAALSIDKILSKYKDLKNIKTVISGISGGCGSIAAGIMNKIGFEVTGISRRTEDLKEFKEFTGITRIIDVNDFINENKQNLAIPRWDFGIDFVGGEILKQILKMIKINGDVTTAGMANSSQIETSILPFILRGITLHGINTEESLNIYSAKIWDKLSKEWKPNNFSNMFKVINLDELPEYLNLYLNNKIIGRVVVKHKF